MTRPKPVQEALDFFKEKKRRYDRLIVFSRCLSECSGLRYTEVKHTLRDIYPDADELALELGKDWIDWDKDTGYYPGPVLENRDCTACELHGGVTHVGIGTYLVDDPTRPVSTGVVLLGQNPGWEEDRVGAPAIGKSGQFLRRVLIDGLPLRGRASVYVTNTVQCFDVEPTNKQYKTCFEKHFPEFLSWLFTEHERIAVVCLGGKAAHNFFRHYTGTPVSVKARHLSGTTVETLGGPVTAFTTFHPAFLIRPDGKAKIWGFFDHMRLLDQWLDGLITPYCKPDIIPATSPEKYFESHP